MSTAENVFDMDVDLEGADGQEGESGLEAAIAASRRAETRSAQVMLDADTRSLLWIEGSTFDGHSVSFAHLLL